MKRAVIIQPTAFADIRAHYEYLFSRSPQGATTRLSGIHAAIADLAMYADWHPVAPEAAEAGYPVRQILYGRRQYKHRILYLVSDVEVHVLHVRHGMRKPITE